MSEAKRVLKNSGFIFFTNLFSKILTIILIIVLARYLGVEGYGKLSFVLSFTGLFAVFGNFGLSLLLKRIVARERDKVNYYFSNALVISTILNILTFIVIMIFAWILRYEPYTIKLIFIGALFVIFQNFKTPFQSVYEAFERMHYVFWTRLSKVVLRLCLVLFFIYMQQGLEIILITYALVEFVMIFVDFWVYNKYIEKLRFKFETKLWKGMIKSAIPFGIAGVFMTIYDKIDVTMISKMVLNPDVAIGFYSSSYELMSSLMFIALAISGALAPIAYRAFLNNKKKLIKIYTDSFKLFLILSIPIAVGGTILADKIIYLIYGVEYYGAIPSLKILIWATIFNFQMFAFGLALNSINLEKETMKATIYSVIFNVVANLIFIPIYGYIAAAYTTVGSVFVYSAYCYIITQKKLVKVNLLKILAPIVTSSVLMGCAIYFLREYLHFIFLILIGVFIYFALLLLLKGIEIKEIKELFLQIVNKN